MSMYATKCTLCIKNGVKNPPAPVHFSKCWAYCRSCYISRFPAESIRRGYIEGELKAPKKEKKKKNQIVEVFIQDTLFDFEEKEKFDIRKFGCGCTGNLP